MNNEDLKYHEEGVQHHIYLDGTSESDMFRSEHCLTCKVQSVQHFHVGYPKKSAIISAFRDICLQYGL